MNRRLLVIMGAATAWAQSGMTTFQHPSGVSMSYPQDWRLDRKDETIFLTPKDAGDGETIVLGGEEAEGLTCARCAILRAIHHESRPAIAARGRGESRGHGPWARNHFFVRREKLRRP